MLFGQVPAARADHQHRGIVADRIMLAAVGIGVVEPPGPVIAQVHLALDQLVPHRRGRVLEIGHERLRAAVERVDQHLGVGRAGDLDPAIEKVGGDAADRPVGLANLARVLGKIGQLAGIEPRLPFDPPVEQFAAARVEPLVQLGEEIERGFGQDLVGAADFRRFGNDAGTVEHFTHNSTGSTQIE